MKLAKWRMLCGVLACEAMLCGCGGDLSARDSSQDKDEQQRVSEIEPERAEIIQGTVLHAAKVMWLSEFLYENSLKAADQYGAGLVNSNGTTQSCPDGGEMRWNESQYESPLLEMTRKISAAYDHCGFRDPASGAVFRLTGKASVEIEMTKVQDEPPKETVIVKVGKSGEADDWLELDDGIAPVNLQWEVKRSGSEFGKHHIYQGIVVLSKLAVDRLGYDRRTTIGEQKFDYIRDGDSEGGYRLFCEVSTRLSADTSMTSSQAPMQWAVSVQTKGGVPKLKTWSLFPALLLEPDELWAKWKPIYPDVVDMDAAHVSGDALSKESFGTFGRSYAADFFREISRSAGYCAD